MSSVQNLFSWLKRGNKGAKKINKRAQDDFIDSIEKKTGCLFDAVTPGVVSGSTKCHPVVEKLPKAPSSRQSLMLPPIPRDQLFSHLPDRLWSDSPSSHVYEEIPLSTFELETQAERDKTNVNLDHLDLPNAKEVGPYLVVPLKDALSGRVIVSTSPTQGINCGDIIHNPSNLSIHHHNSHQSHTPVCHQRTHSVTSAQPSQTNVPFSFCDNVLPNVCQQSQNRHSIAITSNLNITMPHTNVQNKGADNQNNCFRTAGHVQDEELEVLIAGSSERLRLDRQRRNSDSGNHMVKQGSVIDIVPCTMKRTSSRTNSIVSYDSGNSSANSTTLSDTSLPPYSDEMTDSYNGSNMSFKDNLESPGVLTKRPPKHPSSITSSSRASKLHIASPVKKTCSSIKTETSTTPSDSCGQLKKADSGIIETFPESSTLSDENIALDVSSTQDEYEYFLGKVKKNFELKENVHKIILSESSDYEAGSSGGPSSSLDDSLSFTTVTSDDYSASSAFKPCRRHKIKYSKDDMYLKELLKLNPDCAYKSKPQTVRQTKHKSKNYIKAKRTSTNPKNHLNKRKHGKNKSDVVTLERSDEDAEFYCLPDFHQVNNYVSNPAFTIPSPISSDCELADKLSCRVTKLRPEDIRLRAANTASHAKNSASPSKSGKESKTNNLLSDPSIEKKNSSHENIPHCSGKRSGNVNGHRNTSTTPASQNRVLSDLMRMNHDRLTVLF